MPRQLDISDLAAGQLINFRTRTRPWRYYEVLSVDAQHGRFTLKQASDNQATPNTVTLALGDVLVPTLELAQ